MSDARGDVGERAQDPRDGRLISWFQRWRRPIRYWLSSRSSVPAAEIDDLAQEVFLRLLRYSDDIAIDNPQSYLFRIASNVANEWREHVQAAVQRLPPRQREVLLLHVNEGLTYKQITDRLGLSPRIVLRDLTRAYSQLRTQLNLEDLEDMDQR